MIEEPGANRDNILNTETINGMLWILFFLVKFILCAILISIQVFFFRFLRQHFTSVGTSQKFTAILQTIFVLFSVPLIFLLFDTGWIAHLPAGITGMILTPVYCWHFSWFLIFIFISFEYGVQRIVVMFRLIIRSVAARKNSQPQNQVTFQPTRRKFIRQSFLAATGTIFTTAAYGAIAHDHYDLSRLTIPISGLPDEFDGFTIAFLSDIHSSIFMTKDTMQKYVNATNALKPDMIAVTGDFVNSMVDEVYPFAEAFSSLSAPSGVFGVLGNHDYYTRNVEAVARVVNECGIRLFRNEHIRLKKKNATIVLGGIDDVGYAPAAARLTDRAMNGSPDRATKILLSHRPYFLPEFSSRNIDLTLAGHTHGGQIVLARFGNYVLAPAQIASPYVAGLYTLNQSKMYVSRGIGTIVVPIRVNCPPEITLITLRCSSDGVSS